MKKLSFTILIFSTIFIYRHELFNLLFIYQEFKEIPEQKLINSNIKDDIANTLRNRVWFDIAELNGILLKYTDKRLTFGSKQTSNNINNFRTGSKAHCVGYAAFHNAILNYTLDSLGVEDLRITHVRGEIKLLGFNLNKLSKSKFFKDHDFVKIENIENGEYYYCDPSLYEFSKIHKIGLNYKSFFAAK
jgi:hypothetical protein